MTVLAHSDRQLIEITRPTAWRNPRPEPRYDLVVIGGGTAGLVTAMGAAGLGARVALVERHRLGGECLHNGCVPSKALLRTARAAGELRKAAGVGVRAAAVTVDFAAAVRRMRARRAALAPNDAADRLVRAGVHLFFGDARFAGPREVIVGGDRLRFAHALIATGSRPAVPPIPGLRQIRFLTNETIFDLTACPARLIVVGGGAVGCELAQAFGRFGARVTLIEQGDRLLPHDDENAARIVQQGLEADGVQLALGVRIERVAQQDGAIVVSAVGGADRRTEELVGDRLLVAAGRAANVEALDLETAQIAVGPHGIVADDYLRTTNRRVYAAGDVCGQFQFTHAADAMARIVVQNTLFPVRRKASRLTIPWCTYTDPELAHVGLGAAEASRRHGVQTLTVPFADIDRARLDDETTGFVRVHHRDGRLLGCTIVGTGAGELIGYAAEAIARRSTLTAWASAIFPYPTRAEAFRKAGDAYLRGRLTPAVGRWLERYFQLTRW